MADLLKRIKELNRQNKRDMAIEKQAVDRQQEIKGQAEKRMEQRTAEVDHLIEQVEAEVRMIQGRD